MIFEQIDNYETDSEYPAGVQSRLLEIPEGESATIAGVMVRRESADLWSVKRSSVDYSSGGEWTDPNNMGITISYMRDQREDNPAIKNGDAD